MPARTHRRTHVPPTFSTARQSRTTMPSTATHVHLVRQAMHAIWRAYEPHGRTPTMDEASTRTRWLAAPTCMHACTTRSVWPTDARYESEWPDRSREMYERIKHVVRTLWPISDPPVAGGRPMDAWSGTGTAHRASFTPIIRLTCRLLFRST